MEKQLSEKSLFDPKITASLKRPPDPFFIPPVPQKIIKPDKPELIEKIKTETFPEKYAKFLDSNKSFFEQLKHENSVLLVKNSPQYSYGNYANYYGLRLAKRWEDSRVPLIKSEWVKDKKCLDIGCNEGIFTILIAIRYLPKIIVGCDIDYTLINKAISHIKALEKNNSMVEEIRKNIIPKSASNPASQIYEDKRQELLKRLEKLPKSFTIGLSLPKELTIANENSSISSDFKVVPFPLPLPTKEPENAPPDILERLIFRQENYISDMETLEKYDTVFCLSTAKWIHLHYGDVGIKALFYKVYRSLNEGGIFVFEPQPWKSYKKKKHLSADLKDHYQKIQFFPNQFEDFLLGELNFKMIDKLEPTPSDKKGYDRPIFVLQK